LKKILGLSRSRKNLDEFETADYSILLLRFAVTRSVVVHKKWTIAFYCDTVVRVSWGFFDIPARRNSMKVACAVVLFVFFYSPLAGSTERPKLQDFKIVGGCLPSTPPAAEACLGPGGNYFAVLVPRGTKCVQMVVNWDDLALPADSKWRRLKIGDGVKLPILKGAAGWACGEYDPNHPQ
jgi:hypothetical protein